MPHPATMPVRGQINAKLCPLALQIPYDTSRRSPSRMIDEPSRERLPITWILGLVAIAILIRFAYWSDASHLSLVQVPTGDAATYVYLAEDLGQNGLLAPKHQAYQQAPLYPFFLFALAS